MQHVNFLEPEISEDLRKPVPIENKSFPYTLIADSRRFEELLYSIYKSKIDNSELTNFNNISLMSGVSEQGRDSVMFKNGKACAVIQCKKYTTNLSKDEFGKEITKLILYSLLDDRIIPDPNDFTYYIAVAKDFTADCRALIDNFNSQILAEPNLEEWLKSNLQMPTLQSLKTGDYKTEFRDILSKIKVKKIVPQELDLELIGKPQLAQLFFAVRSVTDNTGTEKILNILNGNLSEEEVSKQLYNGSISLISERNTFEGIEDSHISRSETAQLINWVQSETKKDAKGIMQNVCILAAPAGYGKTVILKDFFSECQSLNLPVLGLKTDKLYSYTITDLQKSIGLTLPVFDFIERCRALYSLTIIVIDQIDALSQSMSSDRQFLEVFKGFINRFENDPNIKIIISVRNQDLNYDPILRQFRNRNTIQVSKLSQEQVLGQLDKIGITKNHVSSKLLELLRIPNNLNIFSRIASNEDSLKVTTIDELYMELWKQKVQQIPNHSKTNKTEIRKALYTIADKMFSSQRITISEHQLEDFSDEIDYLVSEQLIKREEKQLQFFHQSFYDFVFAKQFVEDGKDLLIYIKEAEQSIHIRSAVKMIIAYLRDYDAVLYDKYALQIISDDEIFFHIKHIIFLNILLQPKPTHKEQELVELCLKRSQNFKVLFFEHANGSYWLDFAIGNSLLGLLNDDTNANNISEFEITDPNFEETMSSLKVHFLQRHVVSNDIKAWSYFKKIENPKIIQRILYFITDWDNDDPFSMLAKCPDFINSDTWSYYHVLENISKYDIDFVLNILKETLPQHYKKGNNKRDYDEREVIKSLAKDAPHKLLPILYESIVQNLRKESDFYDSIIRDWTYSYTDLRDEEQYDGKDFLYQKLAYCLKKTASNYKDDFLKFFNTHKSSNHYAILRIILFSLTDNEQRFTNEIIELFNHFQRLGLLTSGDDLEYDMRLLVGKSFQFMNTKQQKIILDTIRNYNDQKELRTWTNDEGKRKLHFFWGLAKYYWLMHIPSDAIQSDAELKKSFLELQRKFPGRKDIPKRRNVIAGTVHSPIPINAQAFMKKKHWLKSFKKYDRDERRWGQDFLKGGKTELSSAFRSEVEKNPSLDKLGTITAVINAVDIPIEFAISGLYGWTQSTADLTKILPAFLKILEKGYPSDQETYITSIAGRFAYLEKTLPEVIDYLVNNSLKHENTDTSFIDTDDNQTSVNKLITKGINTRHGAASGYLAEVGDPTFKDIVFTTIKNILEIGPIESKASIYYRFYYLTRLDRERAHELFVTSLNNETDIHVIASSILSLQYFRTKGLKILDKPYRLLIESGFMGTEDSNKLFTIFYGSYLHNQVGAKELLETLLNSGNLNRSNAIDNIMKYYYTVDHSKSKNDELLEFIMSKVDEEEFNDISWSFYNAGHVSLSDIYEFVKKFIQSKYFKLTDQFIEYLLTQCGKFPFLAIELFESAVTNNKLKVDERHSYEIDAKAIKFIVSAYESVTDKDEKSIAARKKLLQSFDRLLTDLRFRRNQEQILSELI
ncbi:MAG: hypothetical protein DCE86_04400 [Flavobacteriaceae bacterium]|nr:MAG: hypothetical protein DCE86_04400 [Flavobacteriaceae bacterium]